MLRATTMKLIASADSYGRVIPSEPVRQDDLRWMAIDCCIMIFIFRNRKILKFMSGTKYGRK